MKKFFEDPIIEIKKFSVEDVITDSGILDENAGEEDEF